MGSSRKFGWTFNVLANEFLDRSALIDDWGGSSVEVLDEGRVRFDPQVMVDRGKEVTGRTGSFDGVFPTLVGRTDDLSGSDTTAGPDIREGSWPVVATGLDGSGRCAGVAGAGAR